MIKSLSIILFCMFPLLALSQGAEQEAEQGDEQKTEQKAPQTANGESKAGAEASQTNEEVELSEEQRKYNRCVADLLFIVYKNTANCVAFVPTDPQGNPNMDKAAPCFHITAKAAKRIIPTCEPLLNLGPNEEAPAVPQEFTQNAPTATLKAKEKINFDLSESQKQYNLCIAHLLGSIFQGTYTCIFSVPSEAEEDICFNKSTKALTNVFPSCEGFANPKPDEQPAERPDEQPAEQPAE